MSVAWCPLCGHSAFLMPQAKLALYHCLTCDLIFKDKSLYISLEAERQRYATHENTLENAGYVRMLEEFLAKALPFSLPQPCALDYGSGPTPVLQALLKLRGIEADVYDPFFAPLWPGNDPYSLITCTEVLEHVHNPSVTWQHIGSLLAPQGILAVMTHFHPGPSQIREWWYLRDSTHVTFYSARTFNWVSQSFGYSVLYNDGIKTIVLRRHGKPA